VCESIIEIANIVIAERLLAFVCREVFFSCGLRAHTVESQILCSTLRFCGGKNSSQLSESREKLGLNLDNVKSSCSSLGRLCCEAKDQEEKRLAQTPSINNSSR
jgi:hypothetical protein